MEQLNLKPKQVLGTLRIVITNQKISPPIFDCLYILEKEESLRRISSALDSIQFTLDTIFKDYILSLKNISKLR